jgi:hypothetical protein
VLNEGNRTAGRQAWRTLPLFLAPLALAGCANFWDEVTSKDFKIQALWSHPDPIVVLRDSNDGDQRAKALRALHEPKQFGGTDQEQEEVLRILTAAAINERQPWCRFAAIQALGRFKDPRAVTALQTAYEKAGMVPAGNVQQVGFALANNMPPETASTMRCQALVAMGETGNTAAMDLLVRVVRQPPAEGAEVERQQILDERIAAARALGNFNQYEATDALLAVLQKDRDVALRDRACESLQKATGKKLPADAKAWDEYLHQTPGSNGPSAPAERKGTFFGLF